MGLQSFFTAAPLQDFGNMVAIGPATAVCLLMGFALPATQLLSNSAC